MNHLSIRLLGAACAAASLAACTTGPQATATAALKAAAPATLSQCEALATAFRHDNTTLDSAATMPAGTLKLAGQNVAAHCLVKGAMHKRRGSDGRDYAIGFEMRLPQNWNGRFYYQGNGGLDGAVRPAEGALGGGPLTGALMQGFAVISSDAGHTGAQTPYFGAEPQARLDYGYQAVVKLTPMAKGLIASAYGRGPDRSYIGGCSNGGRHAMVAAARIGDQYDGYLVGAPGYRLPNAAMAQLWGVQQWAPLATPGATVKHPLAPNVNIADLGSALTAAERQTVARALLDKCDALDGLRDGMVQATQACQGAFDIRRDVPACAVTAGGAGRNGACLTPAQKDVLAASFAGATTRGGRALYSAFPMDAGIAGANWAQWKFVNALALDPLSVGTVFSSPPTPVDAMKEDLDARMALLTATNATYRESGIAHMSPPGHETAAGMAALQARGARMVLYHGVSDAIFSAEDTRQWMLRLDQATGGKGADFARYFPVPGMNHCSAGPAADQFDLLTPLVQWVEQGVAPGAVTASVRGAGNAGGVNAELPAGWSASRTRPLCAWPTVARYNGSGDIEKASSFSCKP